jgi:biopolymer transport protein ExbD
LSRELRGKAKIKIKAKIKERLVGASDPSSGEDGLMSQINVTPFVDVVLVLLVIFMVTAPIIAKDMMNVRLPKTESGDGKGISSLGVSVNREGQILLNGNPVSEDVLSAEVKRSLRENRETQAIIAGDIETPYGNIVRVIDIIKSAGLSKFAIQVERR